MVRAKGDPKNPFCKLRARPIDTPYGPMTRKEIAAEAGLPLNTIHSRIYAGFKGAELFAPRCLPPRTPRGRSGEYGPYAKRERAKMPRSLSYHDDSKFIEKWADRKARRAREREKCE
jgi:hypothetical protein